MSNDSYLSVFPVLYCGTGALGDSCTVNENVGQFFIWSWIPQFGDLTGHAYVAAGKYNIGIPVAIRMGVHV